MLLTDLRLSWTGAVRQVIAKSPKEFDPRKFLKVGTAAMKDICKVRYEAFGCAGMASKIKPISMDGMRKCYTKCVLNSRAN